MVREMARLTKGGPIADCEPQFLKLHPRLQVVRVHSSLRVNAAALAGVVVAAFHGLRPRLVFVLVARVAATFPKWMVWAAHLQQRFAAPRSADGLAVLWRQALSSQCARYVLPCSFSMRAPALGRGSPSYALWRQFLSAFHGRYATAKVRIALGPTAGIGVSLNRLCGMWSDAAIVATEKSSRLALFYAGLGVGVSGKWRHSSASALAVHRTILPRFDAEERVA